MPTPTPPDPDLAAEHLYRAVHGNDVTSLFAGLRAAFDAVDARVAQQKARQRDAHNARRRAQYAVRKAAGTLPARRPTPTPDPVIDDDVEPDACYCHLGHPPCTWCTSHCADCGHHNDDCECHR